MCILNSEKEAYEPELHEWGSPCLVVLLTQGGLELPTLLSPLLT